MVSLAAVEAMVQRLWPDANHLALALPDTRKGEQIVLVTEQADADRAALLAHAQAHGFPELWVPRSILVASIPVLGSGKTDYAAASEMVRKLRSML